MTLVEMDSLPTASPPSAVPGAETTPPGALPWLPGERVKPVTRCSQGEFVQHLERARVLDMHTVELPGSAIMLPFGMGLVRRFEEVIRHHYELHGFAEYDYPILIPTAILDPTRQLFALDGRLLYAGDDQDWARGHRRAVLTPTGEAAVYAHWTRQVSSRNDLPIRMYRRARYFRPTSAGQGLFRAMEAAGVWEFQSCYPDRDASMAGMASAADMARAVCADLHVPVLWSARPPWTNNGALAERCLGGDVPLPHGATLQVGCVYDQGEQFSRLYGVRWSDATGTHYTRHVTGCVTQRLVLAHLFLGIDAAGELLVHPDLAPTQVAITSSPDEHAAVAELIGGLAGLRVRHEMTQDKRDTGRWHRLWRRQGVPIRVYLQPARFAGDRVKVVVVRADTRAEAVLYLDELDRLVAGLRAGVIEVGLGYRRRSAEFVDSRCVPATADTVRDVLAARLVAVCPLEPTEHTVAEVGSWGLGEVLGLNRTDHTAACVVTGRPTRARAYLSART